MPRIRYIGPIVGVDVVLVGLSDVKPGDEFDASVDVAEQLLSDDSMYVPADAAAEAVVAALDAAQPATNDAAAAAVVDDQAAAEAEAAAVLAAAEAQAAASESGTEITVDQTLEG